MIETKEKKRFLDTELWKYIRTAIELLMLAGFIWAVVAFCNWFGSACAEELRIPAKYIEVDGE